MAFYENELVISSDLLPGESAELIVLFRKGKVWFCKVLKHRTTNIQRINPKCNIFDTRGLIKINDYMKIKNYFRY